MGRCSSVVPPTPKFSHRPETSHSVFCQIFLAVACKLHLSFYRWMQTQVSKLVTVLGKCLLRSSLWVSATLLAALVAQKVSCLQCRRPQFHLWVSRIPLEKGMSTHSSILAWRIPRTEEYGGLQSMGSRRVRHVRVTHTFAFLNAYGLPPMSQNYFMKRCFSVRFLSP